MLRKLVGAAIVMSVCLGIALADEMIVSITKVDGNKITFNPLKGKEKGDEKTMTAADNVKVVKGTYNKDTKSVDDPQPVDDGLKAKAFGKIDSEKGMKAQIVTSGDKITEIRLFKGKKKN